MGLLARRGCPQKSNSQNAGAQTSNTLHELAAGHYYVFGGDDDDDDDDDDDGDLEDDDDDDASQVCGGDDGLWIRFCAD